MPAGKVSKNAINSSFHPVNRDPFLRAQCRALLLWKGLNAELAISVVGDNHNSTAFPKSRSWRSPIVRRRWCIRTLVIKRKQVTKRYENRRHILGR